MSLVEEFFIDIDRRWPRNTAAARLSIIGCGALMLQVNYERGTKDGDVFETTDLTIETQDRLVHIAGEHTDVHRRWNSTSISSATVFPSYPTVPSGIQYTR